jgi:hypothetical protein
MATDGRPCPFCKGTGTYREAHAEKPRELRWTIASDQTTGSHVSLSGEITETANLDRLHRLPHPVVLDLQNVRYLNTMGSLSLIRLIESLGGGVTAERCSPVIVRQLNLMPDLSDHLKVRSVMVPYECPSCHADYTVVTELAGRRPPLPTRRCGSCDTALELDEPIEQYFAFLPA